MQCSTISCFTTKMNVKLNFNSRSFFLSYVSMFLLVLCHAVDAEAITSARIIRDGELVRSENGSFILGFFSPGNSTYRYLGIWFGTFELQTAVWVANREVPVKDSSGLFKISDDGNLVVVDGNGVIHWSSNATVASNNSVYELLNNGNLVLRNDDDAGGSNKIWWQSFDHPSDTFLAEMKFGLNLKTGENQLLTAWKSDNDPAPNNFTLGFDPRGVAQIVIWNNSRRHWRSGLWNGQKFSGVPEMTSYFLYGFNIVTDSDEGRLYSIYSETNKTLLSRFVLSPTGELERSYRNIEARSWDVAWSQPTNDCQFYGKCGPNGICNRNKSPICSCLKGFMPQSPQDWNSGNWSGGCVRKKPLECKEGSVKDGFLKVPNVKLPDYAYQVMSIQGDTDCKTSCEANCSCIAYSYESGLGCLTWQEDLIDIQQFSIGEGDDFYLRLPWSELRGMEKRKWILFFLVITSGAVMLLVSICFICKRIRRKKAKDRNQEMQQFWDLETPRNSNRNFLDKLDGKELEAVVSPRKGPDLPLYGLDAVRTATNDFSMANKLGEGGFGPVYKGNLPSGQEIAVKRLSKGSGQGLQEFENEVILIAKLQHRNLVRLLGCCIQGDERLLIYEYMPNKSLDAFLFVPSKSALLNWKKRFDIIEGIARGLLYLHRDSRLRIIHRDLKASNILLDEEMNPKISDFGMARIFGGQQNQENTMRVVGTYGYMSPEYAMEGFFSVKSDVFSFGVLLLEIVSGKRNAGFCIPDQYVNLLGYAWELWNEDRMLELLDSCLKDSYIENEVRRCIEVGLLCVQDSASDRPTMDHVVFMLGSETAVFDAPQKPSFSLGRTPRETDAIISSERCSANVVTLSKILGR